MFKKKGTYDYDFELINPTKFKLKLTLQASNRIFKFVFNNSRRVLKLKKNIDVPKNILDVDVIDIEEKYFKLIFNFIHKLLKQMKEIILEEDKIKLIYAEIVKCYFIRNESKNWNIEIFLEGDYEDYR